MKTTASVFSMLFITLILGSCSPKLTFQPSSVVPAATGDAQVKTDKNKNHLIRVNVQNLAPPDRLTPPQSHYIVWMESDLNTIKKLGLLTPSSKNLTASIDATAIPSPTRIFITAENNPDIQYPQGQEVLTTNRK